MNVNFLNKSQLLPFHSIGASAVNTEITRPLLSQPVVYEDRGSAHKSDQIILFATKWEIWWGSYEAAGIIFIMEKWYYLYVQSHNSRH